MSKSRLCTVAALIGLAFAGSVSAFDPVDMIRGGANNNFSAVPDVPGGVTRPVTLAPGQCTNIASSLASLTDRDTYLVTTTGTSKLSATITDCCIQGDTICYFGRFQSSCATSPQIVEKVTRFPLPARTYSFQVGYTDTPGGFPAGYDVTICAVQ